MSSQIKYRQLFYTHLFISILFYLQNRLNARMLCLIVNNPNFFEAVVSLVTKRISSSLVFLLLCRDYITLDCLICILPCKSSRDTHMTALLLSVDLWWESCSLTTPNFRGHSCVDLKYRACSWIHR